MSRKPFSFRPQVESLGDRLAPGSLLGQPDLTPGLDLLAGVLAARQQGAIQTTSDVIRISNGTVVGSSTLIRTDNGVIAHLTAAGVDPGVYSFWMKVDTLLPNGTTVTVSGRLGGHVVGQDGNINFSAQVKTGEILGAGDDRNPDFPSGPLQDPLHSTITVVARYHGEADPGRIYEQTHTYELGTAMNFLRSIHNPPA